MKMLAGCDKQFHFKVANRTGRSALTGLLALVAPWHWIPVVLVLTNRYTTVFQGA